MPEVYSHSRLGTFENCPKQFHYRYVLQVPAPTESIEAFVGKRVHEVIERIHLALARDHVPSLDAVLRRFRALWEQHYAPGRIRVARPENPVDTYREAGERCLGNFYRRHYPFDRDETLGVEERVRFQLDARGAYRMRGIIDRIARAPDGAVEIHDYKTSQRVPPQSVLDRDRQLALYQIALKQNGLGKRFGEAPVRLVWHYLLPDRVRVSTRSPDQLSQLGERTMALIDRVESETRFEPRPGPLCGWCEYRAQCPAVADPRAAADEAPAPPPAALPARTPRQLALFADSNPA